MPNTSPGPLLAVEQPHLTPPRVSLLTSADRPVLSETDKLRFGNGFRYAPEGDVVMGTWPICDGNNVDPGNPDYASNPKKTPNFQFSNTGQEGRPYSPFVDAVGAVNFAPYGIYASDASGTFSWRARDGEARAKRKLDAGLSYMLEHELWTGSTNVLGRANPSLQNAARVLTTGPICIFDAIALLEQATADGDARGSQKGGMRYMIHVRPKVLDYIEVNANSNFVRRDGNMYLTPMDNIVVPGRGYPGTGPNADTGGAAALPAYPLIKGPGTYAGPGSAITATTEWIYLTPVVEVRLDDVMVLGDDPSQVISRRDNTVTYWAERIAHAAFDPTLNIYAAEICLTTCDC